MSPEMISSHPPFNRTKTPHENQEIPPRASKCISEHVGWEFADLHSTIVKYFAFRLNNISESRYEDVVYLERPSPPVSLALSKAGMKLFHRESRSLPPYVVFHHLATRTRSPEAEEAAVDEDDMQCCLLPKSVPRTYVP